MPTVTDLAITAPGIEIQLIVPSEWEQAVQKPGHIKCLLWFETEQPRFATSLILQTTPYDIQGSPLEYVAVLKKASETYDLLWAFLEDLERMKDKGVVPPDARLTGVDFIEEDRRFLAWVV